MSTAIKREEPESVPSQQLDADPVVREIDVYLSTEMADHLHLIQYPLQQADGLHTAATAARLKSRHHLLQIDHELPPLPGRVYHPMEQNFAFMSTRTFQSETVPVETHLCLGKIQADGGGSNKSSMFLVPVQNISQMRPTMDHIRDDRGGDEAANDEAEPMEEDKEIGSKPLVYQRKETERAAMARKSSYAYKRDSEAAEEWEELDVAIEDSEESIDMVEHMCNAAKRSKSYKSAASRAARGRRPQVDYVESLNYIAPHADDTLTMPVSSDDPKTIVARLTVLLRQGLPIPYAILRAQLPKELTDAQVFRSLSVCAIMVRGNFCLHSRFVSLPRELQRARTFILSILQTRGLIRRQCLEKVYEYDPRVSSEKLHILLQLIAKRTPKGWVLRIGDDVSFVENHPEQSQLYLRCWDRVFESTKEKELLEAYNAALKETSQ
jgi:hypothetical protein